VPCASDPRRAQHCSSQPGRMLVQDRDAQHYEPPLVQTEGQNAKKKKKKRNKNVRSAFVQTAEVSKHLQIYKSMDIQKCWPTKENGNEGKKLMSMKFQSK